MKKIVLATVILSIGLFGYSQGKRDVTNAYSHYTNQNFEKAKVAIDNALLDETVKSDPKAWIYKGNIYLQIANDVNLSKKYPNAAEVAFEAYMKSFEIDPKYQASSMNITTARQGLSYCSGLLVEESMAKIQQGDYPEAYRLAAFSYKADKTEYSVYAMGVTAEQVNEMAVAKDRYTEFVKAKYSFALLPYARLANMYKDANDTVNAIKTIRTAAEVFMKDTVHVDCAVACSIIFTWANQQDSAQAFMEKALKKEPNNHILLINYGNAMSEQKKYDQAEAYFLRAVELSPDDATALFNIGSCYYNIAVDIYKKLDEIDINDMEAYNKAQEEFKTQMGKARPYLEKAHVVDAKDKNTMIMLKNIYTHLGLNNEREEIDQKLNSNQ